MGSELSQEFLVQVDVHEGSVFLPLVFAIAVDIILENAREGLMNKILYADDLALMSKSMENLKKKFLKWKKAFESKGLRLNIKKTKVMVSGLKDEVLKSKVDPCAKCGKRVVANSVMCTKCCKWVHGRCAKMKRVTSTLAKGFVCELCVYAKKVIVEPDEEISFLPRLTLLRAFVIWGTG